MKAKKNRQCKECGTALGFRVRGYCSPKCRVLSGIRVDRKTGCWLWTGCFGGGGYGYVKWRGKRTNAHRLSFEAFRGQIPEGKIVCHSCDVPSCVNPDHLWAGTFKDNTQDMMRKGRNSGCDSQFSDEQISEIRRSEKTLRELGKIYGVSHAMIGYIKAGQRYATPK